MLIPAAKARLPNPDHVIVQPSLLERNNSGVVISASMMFCFVTKHRIWTAQRPNVLGIIVFVLKLSSAYGIVANAHETMSLLIS